MPNMRQDSRKEWGSGSSVQDINAGSLQRIADATEAMAKNWNALTAERDRYEHWYRREVDLRESAERSNSALRGVITKLRKRLEAGGTEA